MRKGSSRSDFNRVGRHGSDDTSESDSEVDDEESEDDDDSDDCQWEDDETIFEGVAEDDEPYVHSPVCIADVAVGMFVMGRWSDDDGARQWYTARVTDVHSDGTVSLRFMGDPKPLRVAEHDIGKRRLGESASAV